MEERLTVDNQMDGYKQNVVKLRENILNNNIEKFLWYFFIKTQPDYVCFVFDKIRCVKYHATLAITRTIWHLPTNYTKN